jgi:TolB-like protein/Tfp pilus assembly protein PilF
LPLENLSSDPGQEYFTDGLTDELITELGEIHELRVISRSSSMGYKRVHKSAREIARELNVDAIVEGTVLRSGDRVRITVQLVDAPADKHLWAKSYTGEVQDVLRLQEDVAHDVANQVSQLGGIVRPANTNSLAVSPQAHEAYFLGRYYWEKRGAAGNTPAAIRYFQKAIDDAPQFAAAYAALAEAYAIVPDYSSARPGDSYAKAEAAANRALELDPYSAQAHTTLALVAANKDFDWQGSESEFQRALNLNPSYSNAHHWHAFNLVFAGKFTDAIAEINQARDLDPLSTIVNANVGFFFYLAGMQERAIQIETKCLEGDPNNPEVHRYLGLALLQNRDYRGAIHHLRSAVDLSNNYPEYAGELSYAYAVAGDRGQATHLLRDMERRARDGYISSFSLAVAYAGLGKRVAALNALQRAIDERSDMIPTLKVNPLFAMLHKDRRFAELLRRINLAG